jgi:hypothetical protein
MPIKNFYVCSRIYDINLQNIEKQCWQQAAAPGGEVAPQEENSVTTSGGSVPSTESTI